jgi:HD-like signal output (HDOD) protein
MKQILFVDDESKLLDGLKRSMRPMRDEWNMMFVSGGEEALKMLEQAPFDVVVSDMRMPGMDGAQLLNEVQRRHPQTVRIILSGHSDQQMIFESISATHQFITKPCETEQLKATIRRACALRELLKDDSVRALVAGMQTIPSLPALFAEIKKEVESESSSLKTIGNIMAKDMGMTARILQIVNSAYFGVRGPVSTVEQAVSFIGLDTIQALVLTSHVFSQFQVRSASAFHVDRLWTHGMETGALAREIAKAEGLAPVQIDQAYTAGLLHDVGILMLAANRADQFSAMFAEASAKGKAVLEVERSEFGITHAEIGAYLLGIWGLSDPIVEAVAYHHRPGDCPGEIVSPLTAVHVANVLQQECSQLATEDVLSKLDMAYLDKLRLTDRLPRWRELAGVLRKEQTND